MVKKLKSDEDSTKDKLGEMEGELKIKCNKTITIQWALQLARNFGGNINLISLSTSLVWLQLRLCEQSC